MLYLQKLIWNVFALFFHGNQKSPNQQRIEAWFGSRKTSAAIRTSLSHVENLITGVSKGYRYKMRFVYAHFPINTSITNANKSIEIRNFLGEKKASVFDGESSRNLSKVMIGGLFLSSLKLLKSLMNMWVNLNAIKRLVEADALKMEIIPNPKDWSLHNP